MANFVELEHKVSVCANVLLSIAISDDELSAEGAVANFQSELGNHWHPIHAAQLLSGKAVLALIERTSQPADRQRLREARARSGVLKVVAAFLNRGHYDFA